jgi:hypothetical protein
MVNDQPELQIPFADTSVWFTPAQWNNFNDGDNDLGAGGPLLFDVQSRYCWVGANSASCSFLIARISAV